MQITLFGALVLLIGIWCQFGPYQRSIMAMFGLAVFGAASAIDLPALGGASITPANFFLIFFLLRLVSMRQGTSAFVAEMGPRRPLFIFVLLALWILASAILLPRLFDGTTDVFSLARTLDNDPDMTPLHPTSGNISQAVYAVGGVVVACGTCALARRPGGTAAILSALTLVTTLHLTFAILDLVTSATHTGFLLDPIRTAGYAFLTDVELGGVKRIAGSFAEASAFAEFSLTLLGVNLVLFLLRVKPRFTGTASLLLAIFIVLSTSSAGYAGLVVVFAVFLCYAFVMSVIVRQRRVAMIAVGAVAMVVLVVSLVILFLPSVANLAQKVISESLLNKSTTDSAAERGSWNTQAWQVFIATHGIGAGIGSTRCSNYALVLLSNLGAIGFGLFALLMLRATCSRLATGLGDDARALVWAARIGLLTTLVPSLLIGTVYDLGTLFYGLVGIAASGAALPRERWVRSTFIRHPSRRPSAIPAK